MGRPLRRVRAETLDKSIRRRSAFRRTVSDRTRHEFEHRPGRERQRLRPAWTEGSRGMARQRNQPDQRVTRTNCMRHSSAHCSLSADTGATRGMGYGLAFIVDLFAGALTQLASTSSCSTSPCYVSRERQARPVIRLLFASGDTTPVRESRRGVQRDIEGVQRGPGSWRSQR